MNASMSAEVIVSPLKEIQRCLVVNSMHLFKIRHRSLLDQAGAIRLGSLSRRTPQGLMSPMIEVYALLVVLVSRRSRQIIAHKPTRIPAMAADLRRCVGSINLGCAFGHQKGAITQ